MLFFGNLLKESGVTRRLANTASGPLIDTITILLGLTVGASTQASEFLTLDSIKIFALGALSFIIATASGVIFVKIFNLFLKKGNKINPLIGNAGVSAVPDSARISQVDRSGIRSDQLLADARYGSERSRCNRFGCCCRYPVRILNVGTRCPCQASIRNAGTKY